MTKPSSNPMPFADADTLVQSPSWLRPVKQQALERFHTLGFPTSSDEAWKYTNVTPLTKVPFKTASQASSVSKRGLESLIPAGDNRIVFVNAKYDPTLSQLKDLPKGVLLTNLAEAWAKHRDQVDPYLTKYASFEEAAFVALNTALVQDGLFLYIPEGIVIEAPIQLVFLSMDEKEGVAFHAHPRVLMVAEARTKVSLIEHHLGLARNPYFSNYVGEFVLGANAQLEHTKLQRESHQAFHISTQRIRQEASSEFISHSFSLGGQLVRNDIQVSLDAENARCTLNGLFITSGTQHIDNFTQIEHAKPHCKSNELYKGVLDGKSRGVFNGKIIVRPDAQKTDATQTNRNLLLSEDAEIDTRPQLEIYADDVKCTHGAAIGQLDPDAIFYLKSRGIDEKSARAMLTFAFANDIVEKLPAGEFRKSLGTLVKNLLAHRGLA